jgi:hypothetical protein
LFRYISGNSFKILSDLFYFRIYSVAQIIWSSRQTVHTISKHLKIPNNTNSRGIIFLFALQYQYVYFLSRHTKSCVLHMHHVIEQTFSYTNIIFCLTSDKLYPENIHYFLCNKSQTFSYTFLFFIAKSVKDPDT